MPIINIENSVSLLQYPKPRTTDNLPREVSLGDLHGNALKLLHFLLTENIVELGESDYQAFIKIYEKALNAPCNIDENCENTALNITADDINEFKKITSHLKKTDKPISARFLGDTLADRGANDFLTLWMFFRLEKLGVPFEIIFSNHDQEFLKIIEGVLLIYHTSEPKVDPKDFGRQPLLAEYSSLSRFEKLFQDGLLPLERIEFLLANFKKHLKAIGYTIDNNDSITIFTHARRESFQIKALAAELKCEFSDNTPDAYKASIDRINEAFCSKIMHNSYVVPYGYLSAMGKTKRHKVYKEPLTPSMVPEIFDLIWSRDTFIEERNQYFRDNPGSCQAHHVFGHMGPNLNKATAMTAQVENPLVTYTNLDDTFLGRASPRRERSYSKQDQLLLRYISCSQDKTTLKASSILMTHPAPVAEVVLGTQVNTYQASKRPASAVNPSVEVESDRCNKKQNLSPMPAPAFTW